VPVRRLALARLVSVIGGSAAWVALYATLYARTGSAGWVAAGLTAASVAAGLCALPAGRLADRVSRRRLLVAADLAAAAAWAVAVVLADRDAALLACATAGLALQTPVAPATGAAVGLLVAPGELARANGLLAAARFAGILVGPVLGGLLVGTAGVEAALALNVVSFACSAALVATIRTDLGPAARARRPGRIRLRQPPLVRTLALATAVLFLGAGLETVAQVPLAATLDLGATSLGLLVAAWSGGALLGALLARTGRLGVRTGFAATAAGLAVVGAAPGTAVVLLGQLVGGVGEGIAGVAGQALLQRALPEGRRGSAIATVEAAGGVAIAAGQPLGGMVAGRVGAPAAYLAAAGLSAAGLALLCYPRRFSMPSGAGAGSAPAGACAGTPVGASTPSTSGSSPDS
jgi:MFS family permease